MDNAVRDITEASVAPAAKSEVKRVILKLLQENGIMLDGPKNWRKGQTLFNFLWWLKDEKKYHTEFGIDGMVGGRMADPFYIEDEELDKLYKEYMTSLGY